MKVRVRTPDGPAFLEREVGAVRPPEPPFLPIIFSQTELTRRSIAAAPAIQLLDLHVTDVKALKRAIEEQAVGVRRLFQEAMELASKASGIRERVNNGADGLAVTRAQLEEVTGTESAALLAAGASRMSAWREGARQAVRTWSEQARLTECHVPAPPTLHAGAEGLEKFAPHDEISRIVKAAEKVAIDAVRSATSSISQVLNTQDVAFSEVQADVEAQLADAGFEHGTEVEAKLRELRGRLTKLEDEEQYLRQLDSQIDALLLRIKERHSAASRAKVALSEARRTACRAVNLSMHTFFAKVESDGDTSEVDSIIDDLKTGTWMRSGSRAALRDSLDRLALLESALRSAQGVAEQSGDTDQGRLVAEALRRNKTDELVRLSCLWSDDILAISQKGTPPTAFADLTEGLRALAIKEISFASSDLPVVTDQPEDAVPTRSVYESLVPTLREQRVKRQFIVVSHDANIVVASDVERVAVLQWEEDGAARIGSLFDPGIREAALEHLEGGRGAFDLRARRYAHGPRLGGSNA